MTIEQLRQMHQARPFRPFRVHMADGRHLDVAHPEFLAHTPGDHHRPPPPGEIPTVSEWGVAIMALLLLVCRKVDFTRRRAMQA
jgi:hypothetical protein